MSNAIIIAIDHYRERIVGLMADDLIRNGLPADENGAVHVLFGRYTYGNVAAYAGLALIEAQRRLVAPEMAKP